MNNTIILIGRLTHKPEIRYTSSNKGVINTTIAVQRDYKGVNGEYDTDFIDIQVWDKRAETINEYCEKGDLIAIKGSLRVDTYQDKDGNNKKKHYVLAERISFLQPKTKKTIVKEEKIEEKEETTDPFIEFSNEVEIDDSMLPF